MGNTTALGRLLFALPLVSAVLSAQVPGLGVLQFEPNLASKFPVPLSLGRGHHSLAIPLSTTVLGVDLVAQAALFDPQRIVLSNAVFDVVR